MAKKEKLSVPESKTPELTKAKKALDTYLKENKLDPTKDWTKDKKHGKKVTELVNKLNKERDKIAAKFPETNEKSEKKLAKLKKKGMDYKAEQEAAGESKKGGRVATKYDYPKIDGREMTSAEKKKYRMEQRKLAEGKAPKPEKKEKKKKVEKAAEPAKEEKKTSTKKVKKAKSTKDED